MPARIRPAAVADAIGVFGAAEYDGRPSPVYRARLDHALALYHRGIAPLIITLGGNGGDQYNEGAVGREYLMAMGIPESAIIAETESRNTEESARRIAVIARANGLRRLVIVSDGTHLFRIHEICAAERTRRAHFAAPPRRDRGRRRRRRRRFRAHRARDSELYGVADAFALRMS